METAMPAVRERKLSLEEFRSRFADEKPYFEYWDGEAVQKTRPTRLHLLIQEILVRLLGALVITSINTRTYYWP
jgi:Uma2 family endonuclease